MSEFVPVSGEVLTEAQKRQQSVGHCVICGIPYPCEPCPDPDRRCTAEYGGVARWVESVTVVHYTIGPDGTLTTIDPGQ